ncbi:MAG: DNA polymerase III subunit delta' [Chloroflexota bacterium]
MSKESPSARAAPASGQWDLLGHDAAVAILRRAVAGGDLSHAYLFSGAPGIGTSTLARALALSLICAADPGAGVPCRACAQCRLMLAGNHPDVMTLTRDPDKQVITTAQLKAFESRIALLPYQARRSVYIIEDAHLLHEAAANALLKTLEEPPAHAVLLLTTSDEDAVPLTVRSRCQIIALRPVPAPRIARWLEDVDGLPGPRARTLATLSGGRPGWARAAAADQTLVGAYDERLESMANLLDLDLAGRIAAVPRLLNRATFNENRALAADLLDLLLQWVRDLLVVAEGLPDLVVATRQFERLESQAAHLNRERLQQAITLIRQAMLDVEHNLTPRLVLENLLLHLPAVRPAGGRR